MGAPQARRRFVVAQPNLRGFRGLTLDAFGALLDGGPLQVPAAYVHAVEERGLVQDRVRLGDRWQSTFRKHLRTEPFISFREVHRRTFLELFEGIRVSPDVDEIVDETLDGYRRVRVYPEVPEVIRELEQEVPLAVISNMDTRLLLEALQRNGLALTFVITSEEEQRYKPSVSLFKRAIRYLGLPAAHVLHVGDSYAEDVVGASAVGMASLLIRRPSGPPDPEGEAKRVVHNLHEVRAFLRRSWGDE